jgi:hypothetical protein
MVSLPEITREIRRTNIARPALIIGKAIFGIFI